MLLLAITLQFDVRRPLRCVVFGLRLLSYCFCLCLFLFVCDCRVLGTRHTAFAELRCFCCDLCCVLCQFALFVCRLLLVTCRSSWVFVHQVAVVMLESNEFSLINSLLKFILRLCCCCVQIVLFSVKYY